jgi:hypothetical protein
MLWRFFHPPHDNVCTAAAPHPPQRRCIHAARPVSTPKPERVNRMLAGSSRFTRISDKTQWSSLCRNTRHKESPFSAAAAKFHQIVLQPEAHANPKQGAASP